MSLQSALIRARKLVKIASDKANSTDNTIIITKCEGDYIPGALVVILWSEEGDLRDSTLISPSI